MQEIPSAMISLHHSIHLPQIQVTSFQDCMWLPTWQGNKTQTHMIPLTLQNALVNVQLHIYHNTHSWPQVSSAGNATTTTNSSMYACTRLHGDTYDHDLLSSIWHLTKPLNAKLSEIQCINCVPENTFNPLGPRSAAALSLQNPTRREVTVSNDPGIQL